MLGGQDRWERREGAQQTKHNTDVLPDLVTRRPHL